MKAPTPARPKTLKLRPEDWVHSTGKRALLLSNERRLEGLPGRLARLRKKGWGKHFPDLGPSLDALVEAGQNLPQEILHDPCLQGWLALAEESLERPPSESEQLRRMLLAQIHGLAAALALGEGRAIVISTLLDQEGHFHLHGAGSYLDFGKTAALAPARLTLAPDVDRHDAFRREPAIMEGIDATCCDPLLMPALTRELGPKEHPVASFSPKEMNKYVSVLRKGIAEIEAVDPLQAAELCDGIKMIVPLERKITDAHVSSTYSHLRGAIYLCHDASPVLQAETLVHEFSHDKLNAFLEIEPCFKGRESDALYFSPWRPDPRTLRGILLGAHAFLNVARFLASVAATKMGERMRKSLQTDSAMRCLQVGEALDALDAHAELTPMGAGLCRAMRASQEAVVSKLPPKPGGIWGAAGEPVANHSGRYRASDRWFHKQSV